MKLGFSLIELMVVIAIIALLAAVAVPSYAEYVDRTRAAEIMTLSSKLLTEWAENDALGNTQSDSNTTTLGDYIASTSFDSTGVNVTLNSSTDLPTVVQAKVLEFDATSTTGGISWSCTVTGGASAADRTSAATYFDGCVGGA